MLHLLQDELLDNIANNFPDFWIQYVTRGVTLPGADIDQGVELNKIITVFFYPKIEPPEIFLCGAVFEKHPLQVGMQIRIDGQKMKLHIGDAFYHIAEGVLGNRTEFFPGYGLLKDLHEDSFPQRYKRK